jgi:23S rRNA (cytosine1962-C5)-methyltransferase
MSPTPDDYQLLDFGAGRKLERFGPWLLDRPHPAVEGTARHDPALWAELTARYEAPRAAAGRWKPGEASWQPTEVGFRGCGFELELCPLPSGQVGVFPEQAGNWQWIARQVKRAKSQPGASSPEVLNLFGYTGGSTLAAAAAGAQVTHVDSAKSVVARARRNAEVSGLAQRPIRWIVEDARKFCQREVRRGRTYDAVILDPPSFGRGPKTEAWSIHRDLLPLLQLCGELTRGRLAFALLTCHTPSIGRAELAAYLSDGLLGSCSQPPQSVELNLTAQDGRQLPCGLCARWP